MQTFFWTFVNPKTVAEAARRLENCSRISSSRNTRNSSLLGATKEASFFQLLIIVNEKLRNYVIVKPGYFTLSGTSTCLKITINLIFLFYCFLFSYSVKLRITSIQIRAVIS